MLASMATTPYPLPRETRETAVLDGNGTAGPYGPTGFKVFDTNDVVVLLRPDGGVHFEPVAASISKTAGIEFDTVSVTFADPVPVSSKFVIQARRTHARQLAVTRSGTMDAPQLEKELSKQATVISELRRDIDNSLLLPPGTGGRSVEILPEGHYYLTDADGNMVDGGTGQEIANAEAYSLAARAAAALAQAGAGAPVFSTKAIAEAYAPAVAPDFINTAFTNTDQLPGSGGVFADVGAVDPGLPGASLQIEVAGSPRFYVLREPQVYVDQFYSDGAMAGDPVYDTEAFTRARNYCAAPGSDSAKLRLRARTYEIDENVEINTDHLYLEGDNWELSTLRLPRTRGGWLLAWATTRDTEGGGLHNVRLEGYPDITAEEASGNAGVRFGSSGGMHFHANNRTVDGLICDGFAQYGLGVENGSGGSIKRFRSRNHGYTVQGLPFCIPFYVFPKDEVKKSRGLVLDDIEGEISDAYEALVGANPYGAAVKLQAMVDLKASKITAVGGKESVCSIDSINQAKIRDLHVEAKAGIVGLAIRSRANRIGGVAQHGFTSLLTEINGLRMRHGAGGRIILAFGNGIGGGGEVTVDGFNLFDVIGPVCDIQFTHDAHVDNFTMRKFSVRSIKSYAGSTASAPAGQTNTGWNLSNGELSAASQIEASSSDFDDIVQHNAPLTILGNGNRMVPGSVRGGSGGGVAVVDGGTGNTGLWFRGIGSFDPPSLAAGVTSADFTVSVPGAKIGDAVTVGFNNTVLTPVDCRVSAADTISFRAKNTGAGPLDAGPTAVTAVASR